MSLCFAGGLRRYYHEQVSHVLGTSAGLRTAIGCSATRKTSSISSRNSTGEPWLLKPLLKRSSGSSDGERLATEHALPKRRNAAKTKAGHPPNTSSDQVGVNTKSETGGHEKWLSKIFSSVRLLSTTQLSIGHANRRSGQPAGYLPHLRREMYNTHLTTNRQPAYRQPHIPVGLPFFLTESLASGFSYHSSHGSAATYRGQEEQSPEGGSAEVASLLSAPFAECFVNEDHLADDHLAASLLDGSSDDEQANEAAWAAACVNPGHVGVGRNAVGDCRSKAYKATPRDIAQTAQSTSSLKQSRDKQKGSGTAVSSPFRKKASSLQQRRQAKEPAAPISSLTGRVLSDWKQHEGAKRVERTEDNTASDRRRERRLHNDTCPSDSDSDKPRRPPDFVLGLVVRSKVLGYAVLSYCTARTVKTGFAVLTQLQELQQSVQEIMNVLVQVKEAVEKEMSRDQDEGVGRGGTSSTSGVGANDCRWVIGIEDCMRMKKSADGIKKVAKVTKLCGVVESECLRSFQVPSVTCVSPSTAKRYAEIRHGRVIRTSSELLEYVLTQVPEFPVLRDEHDSPKEITKCMSDAWAVGNCAKREHKVAEVKNTPRLLSYLARRVSTDKRIAALQQTLAGSVSPFIARELKQVMQSRTEALTEDAIHRYLNYKESRNKSTSTRKPLSTAA